MLSDLIALAVFTIVMSLIAAFYYLRVIKVRRRLDGGRSTPVSLSLKLRFII